MSDAPAAHPPVTCGSDPSFPGRRALQVGARTVHIAATGLVLGGIAYGGPAAPLLAPLWVAVVSGLVLLVLEMGPRAEYFTQGNGLAVLLKLALLGAGWWLAPDARLALFLAATAAASVGSHMPRAWRHWSPLPARTNA